MKLHFSVTGEFITDMARTWYWLDKRPWELVEKLLLGCMMGTGQSKEELVELAKKVVHGQAKFIGNTADDSFAMVDDDPKTALVGYYCVNGEPPEIDVDDYGWLSPSGVFYPVSFGMHEKWAARKCKELGIEAVVFNKARLYGDALVKAGWVLLDSPEYETASVTRNEAKPLTKAQREFLFGYYVDRGLNATATKYLYDD